MVARVRRAIVVVVSTRAAAGTTRDLTGPVIAAWLAQRGFVADEPVVVPDGGAVTDALGAALAAAPDVIVTTGGTGVSPDDRTPEQVAPLLDVQLPGLIEEIRRRGAQTVPTALLTRGVAGFIGDAFVITLPGSPGGVRDGLDVLDPVLEHVLAQRSGSAAGAHRER
ncbi:MogA/MoaB family molybdenum cofactor biosynthesis protein [Leucobacter triazinivorans]|uniref:MogA/MoaB family molybdenum cofactor biosynthesis protein n=1 Tax=Leucobacter triazinivorans TaxID=1784719 RepID=A0A4P6KDI7_9MICO|nr:MogA/MoaB family molybdenum cofactor biosynthesis protein [Leucobacter triazinivorans]